MNTVRKIYFLLFLLLSLSLNAMDFGLKFKSHDVPTGQRTSVSFGDKPYRFKNEFKIGLFVSFYDPSMFGNIATLSTDDGQRVSLVGSMIDDGSFRLALVVNDNIYYVKESLRYDPMSENHLGLKLDRVKNTAGVKFNTSELEFPMDLSHTGAVTVTLGMNDKDILPDVAPVTLRNVRFFIDGNAETHHWDFKFHDTPTTTPDDDGGNHAVVENPHWLIDDHTDWKEIYSLNVSDRIQSTFNPDKELIYLIHSDRIVAFDPVRRDSAVTAVTGGDRVMAYSNHVAYNPATATLVNYNLNRRNISSLDPAIGKWSYTAAGQPDEPNYSNHAVALRGDTLYAFGGYGFYKFRNDLFTVNLRNGEIKEHKLTPAIMPLTSSAAAEVDGKLYIFGGKGNDTGRQELPSAYHYALYEYDTDTWQGRKVWEMDSVKYDFLPTQSMYYDPEDDCFYLAGTSRGGQMLSVSRTRPEINTLSTPILAGMDFHDFVFDLYRSSDGKRYYLVIDKRLDPRNHDLKIYTISAPFISDAQLINEKIPVATESATAGTGTRSAVTWIILIAALAAAGAGAWYYIRKRRQVTAPEPAVAADTTADTEPVASVETPTPDVKSAAMAETAETEDFSFITLAGPSNESRYFDRSRASISLLGGFCVRDKEGNDITVKFTARLKHLLVMLLLSSLKYESGIKYQMIDEEIWGDKDEKSAQNNRNVSLRKLRLLLEEVGNVAITYDKGFFRIDTSDILFDYKELKNRIAEIGNAESVKPEMVDQLLELLLMGPMLPNTSYDWLDNYKADFSNSALDILTKLLDYELNRDDNLAYRIAETISLHDTLNEDALLAKCAILSRRKMYGLAKNIYSRFCKEYFKSMGEDFPVSFAEACKR